MVDSLRTWTALTLVAGLFFWVVYDLIAYAFGGSEATYSRLFWEASEAYRGLALCVCFILGVLVGHLFLPQHV